MIRVLIAGAQFLAEVPTNEQGYPPTTVSPPQVLPSLIPNHQSVQFFKILGKVG